MLVSEFLKIINNMHLPLSQGLDLAAYMLNVDYNSVKSLYNKDIKSEMVEEVINKLNSHTPTAYITGRKEFYGREFYVDENVLIPRVETEILIEEVLKRYKNKQNLEVIDICSGSGAIGLTIMQELKLKSMTLIDISQEAINISKKNANLFNIKENIEYICDDILLYTPLKKYDIVLCNPPYISESEYMCLEEEVKKEPYHALVAKNNGLEFYENIIMKFSLFCKDNGVIFFETGLNQKEDICKIAKSCNLNAEYIQDYALNDRVCIVYK